MTARLRHSPYLSQVAERFSSPASLDTLHAQIEQADGSALLALKGQFALAFAQTDFPDFDEQGRVWSHFADATIARALRLAWDGAAKKHRLTLPKGPVPGLFILGLGKLGGLDLNFSSDVDLIAFYDAEILPVPEAKGQAYIASDVCKRLTQILQPRNAPDFVWRVDWRLRPESSGTGLAISTTKAETFYFFRALPWHRLAMMKARVVAGDATAGAHFLDALEPFIWRRNLDFTMLEELAALKTRINDEHPGLETERAAPDPITLDARGFNLKLGRGGIREIEFIANAQQLVRGGKRPSLRVTNTCAALTALSEAGLLSAETAQQLREDYRAYRQIENAVQMLENQQAYHIPATEDRSALLGLLDETGDLDADIYARRHRVHAQFADMFAEADTPQTAVSTPTLSGAAEDIAKRWRAGFIDHGVNPAAAPGFIPLGQSLVARVAAHTNPDAFSRVDDFLRQLGRSEQYFELLSRHPDLLDTLITPLLHSPHMSEILAQSPHIIDIFLTPQSTTLAAQSAFVLSSPDYERRLEALRRFVNEQLFRAYTRFLDGDDTPALQAQLTAIAEEALTLSIRIVADDLGVAELPLTVLGLGKMGTAKMAPQSDLDLIFIFDDAADPELTAKAVRRLRTTLTTRLREGIAYELDMRLRPSGRSGPPAVKLSSFCDHHMNRAHSWEHIALAPARIVAGDAELGAKVMAVKAEVLARPRDLRAFQEDAYAMYARLSDERLIQTPPNIWRTKLRKGGLMIGDYYASCLTVMGQTPTPRFADSLPRLDRLQVWERLLGLTGKDISETPQRFAPFFAPQTLPQRIRVLEDSVNQARDLVFKGLGEITPPDPRPVIWK